MKYAAGFVNQKSYIVIPYLRYSRMKEITFLKQNHEKWQQFEALLGSAQGSNPDALADLFIRITDDLSWARTFYPGSNTEKYLNDLAARIHQEIYKNKKEKRSRIITFWTKELPLLMAKNRLNLIIAFVIFGLSTWIGIISAQHDEGFVRIILGDGYVDQTLDRMANGDPLGVYKSDNHFTMFLQIAMNNAMVALVCIILGIFGWIGVGFMQFRNGVMLGSFFYFLHSNGFGYEAMHTVWIHGVIEIWCIVVAGAAGMAFGNGLYYPGAWPRGVSFMRGTREALKIGVGLIPFFFLAAFFEGFVTRFTQMNDLMREVIIFGSLIFVIWYFLIYPLILEYETRKLEWASPARRIITLIVIYIIGIISLPWSLLIFFTVHIKQNNQSVNLWTYMHRTRVFNPNSLSFFLLGLLLMILPSIALVMQLITRTWADYATYLFFGLLYLGGLGSVFWGAYAINRVEESDLNIERKNAKAATYEQKA